MKKRTIVMLIMLAIVCVILTAGITAAFFNYTRTGDANTINVGRVYFISREEETFSLSNLYPIDVSNGIPNNSTKVGVYELEIEGDIDYDDGIEYLVSVVNANITRSGKTIPISIDVDIDHLGTESSTYFTARNSKNATIYKRMTGDAIIGNQPLLVGFIKPNTTQGTKEGVNGSITIKVYIDENNIAITDTYDGTESDSKGTEVSWVDGRTVVTTAEWNAFVTSGASFRIRVEANEGIWVEEPLYEVIGRDSVIDNQNNVSKFINNTTPGIDFSQISSNTNGKGIYTRAGTENNAYPIMYFRGDVDNNNVYFAGKCWQIVRTTDTGGIKMIYNGENTGTSSAPACEPATGADRQITLNLSGTDTNTFQFSGNNLYNSPAYNGYMRNSTVYSVTNGNYEEGSKFGNNITWDGTNYTLTNVSDMLDANHHYTCGTANTVTCSNIRYYFAYYTTNGKNKYMYFTLTNGKTIENVVSESLGNGTTESVAKTIVENWYNANIDSTNDAKVEDTVYCNDRSIYQLGGLNPNGGTLTDTTPSLFLYAGYKRNYVDYNPSTECLRPQDAFTKESSNGNGLLNYSVGLITIDEAVMAGGKIGTSNANYYLTTGTQYWTLSPRTFSTDGNSRGFRVYSSGTLDAHSVYNTIGLRPVISLKQGITISDGDGTATDPYIIK